MEEFMGYLIDLICRNLKDILTGRLPKEKHLAMLCPPLAQSRQEISSGIMQAAKFYRNLLKAVGKHIGKEDNKRHFGDFIAQEFRKNLNLSNTAAIQHKIKLARDYTLLLTSVHHHQDLLFSYNIAVDRSNVVKKTLRKSAASVGLQLSDVYQS
ncbi:uncharacterized protein LOC143854823 [Tasmannia lanceolata]|uniref:uncharacterized protein LOC143854823 n=1 Tax=Tasmannia lanceolata TaxID=3420 RepID=UPI004062BF43